MILEELKPWKAKVDEVGKRVIGESLIALNGACKRANESSLACVITDAMLDKVESNLIEKKKLYKWILISSTSIFLCSMKMWHR